MGVLTDNLIADLGGFEDGGQAWPSLGYGEVLREAARSGEWGFRANSPDLNVYPRHSPIPTEPGRRYRLETYIRRVTSGASTSNVQFYVQTTASDGTVSGLWPSYDDGAIARFDSSELPVGEWVKHHGYVTIPDGVVGVNFCVHYTRQGTIVDFDDFAVYDVTDGWPAPLGGVAEIGASTEARLGIVSDVYSRSREKIQLKLAGVDDLCRSGHRIELAAAAMTSAPAVWTWRQITGPAVTLNPKDNTVDFTAPDVERPATIRIGVFASSEDGRNRSDWHYFDLTVEPPMLRFQGEAGGDFTPRSPYLMGYSRGKREIWNDVVRPVTYEENPRHEVEVLDLGVPDDDVVFDTEVPRRMAAGGVWVNPETGDVFRNFGAGYNETDDTTASPRTSTYWVNPANGDILEWIED